jgi:hypothetical protein
MSTLATPPLEKPRPPATESPAPAPPAPTIYLTEREIAIRAYEIYCENGAQDGHDLDHWLQAEQELTALRVRQLTES